MFIEWLISFMSPKLNFKFKLIPHTFTILVNVFIVHLPVQPTDLKIFMISSFPSFITFNPLESPTDSSFATYFKYINFFPFIMPSEKKKNPIRTSYPLVVLWIRIYLLVLETQVWSMVPEDSTCLRSTKPMHNYWAHTLKPMNCNYQTHLLQLLKPACSRAHRLQLLSLYAAITESVRCSYRNPHALGPVNCNRRSLCTEMRVAPVNCN